MYKAISSGNRRITVVIILTVAICFVTLYANYVYGANQLKEPDKKFKSEEELIDETRQAIEKHLNDTEKVRVKTKKVVVPKKDTPGVEIPSEAIEGGISTPGVEIGVKEEKQAATEDPPAATQEDASVAAEKPAVEEQPQTAVPSDVQPITLVKDNEGNLQPVGAEVDFSAKSKGISVEPALEQPILRKMEIEKIGAAPYYETYEGLRLLKYFTAAQRVEIYGEPRPIDSYILDAHAMRYLYGVPWNLDSDYRAQITPIFTRAYGTEITISDPKNKEGQLRYTLDYRDIYKNYWPKYPNLRHEMWDQNEILLMHSKKIDPIDWLYTFNFGYRYSTMSAKSDINYYEVRHTYFSSLSLAPTDKIEYFFQGEYYKSMHVKASYDYRPDHFLGRTEIRIKSNDYKTMYVPQFSYSKDLYYPFANSFEKYEIAFRVGRDFTKRFSASSTLQYVYSYRDEPDNTAPTYAAKNPIKDKAEYISLQNRLSYNLYDRLYLQAGLDIANGLNWSVFDNIGLLGGIEYYAPGMIRVDVGWRGNYYYNLADFLSSVYFKFYLFM